VAKAAVELADWCGVGERYDITVPAADPKPKRSPKPRPKPTREAPANDPRFGSCAAANRAGYGPYVRGADPEYQWYQDRDGDGRVCER
jgi:micrococcal nuclease